MTYMSEAERAELTRRVNLAARVASRRPDGKDQVVFTKAMYSLLTATIAESADISVQSATRQSVAIIEKVLAIIDKMGEASAKTSREHASTIKKFLETVEALGKGASMAIDLAEKNRAQVAELRLRVGTLERSIEAQNSTIAALRQEPRELTTDEMIERDIRVLGLER